MSGPRIERFWSFGGIRLARIGTAISERVAWTTGKVRKQRDQRGTNPSVSITWQQHFSNQTSMTAYMTHATFVQLGRTGTAANPIMTGWPSWSEQQTFGFYKTPRINLTRQTRGKEWLTQAHLLWPTIMIEIELLDYDSQLSSFIMATRVWLSFHTGRTIFPSNPNIFFTEVSMNVRQLHHHNRVQTHAMWAKVF